MHRELLKRLGFVRSRVRRYYHRGHEVPPSKLGTFVLRFRDPQPIGRKDREWQAQRAGYSVLRDTGVACPKSKAVQRLSGNVLQGL
jgi:hypothetical protein